MHHSALETHMRYTLLSNVASIFILSRYNLGVLSWLWENHCPWNEATCAYAAEGGHLPVLKWARAYDCPWDELTCAYAARGGHLQVLKWARERECPWDEGTCVYAAQAEWQYIPHRYCHLPYRYCQLEVVCHIDTVTSHIDTGILRSSAISILSSCQLVTGSPDHI
jgi:hypothetical protein